MKWNMITLVAMVLILGVAVGGLVITISWAS
jgi:hypothetical protein